MRLNIAGLRLDISIPLAAAMAAIIVCDRSMSFMICLAAVIIHESGHLLMLRRFGSAPRQIKLTLFDFVIVDSKKHLRSFSRELAVTLAGVCMNFIAAALAYLIQRFFSVCCSSFIEANLSLAVFNSLPADTLDGGQALLVLLTRKYDPRRARLIVSIVSLIILIPAACAGFLLLLRCPYNFTLLLTSLYLIFCTILSSDDLRLKSVK